MQLTIHHRLVNSVALTIVVFINLFQPSPSRVIAQGIPPGDDAKVIRVVSANTIEVTLPHDSARHGRTG